MYYILIFIKTPHDFVCCSAEPVLFTHCQKRDFGVKNRSVLSKILIGFSENPLELGEIGGDSRTRIFTAFSMRMGAESLENTAFLGFSHLPLSSVKFRQVRFSPLDSKSVCEQSHMGSNPILSANGSRINPVFVRLFHSYIAKVSSSYVGEQISI